MHLRDLRPCDNCGRPHHGLFYVVRFSLAVVRPAAVNEFLGIHQFFQGRAAPALVEQFTPSAADAVRVAMDDADPEIRQLSTEAVICNSCYCSPLLLPSLAEIRTTAIAGPTSGADHTPTTKETATP